MVPVPKGTLCFRVTQRAGWFPPVEDEEGLRVGGRPFIFQLSLSVARVKRGKGPASKRPPSPANLRVASTPQSAEDPCPLPGPLATQVSLLDTTVF